MIRRAGKIPPTQRRWLHVTLAALVLAMVVVACSDRPRAMKSVAVMSSAFSIAAILLVLRQDRSSGS